MTEPLKREGTAEGQIEGKRMRVSDEGRKRTWLDEMEIVDLCEGLKSCGFCDGDGVSRLNLLNPQWNDASTRAHDIAVARAANLCLFW